MTRAAKNAELRATIRARLQDARKRTDGLFALVRHNALLDRPISERHRVIFYVGHLEAFDWNLLCRDSLGLPPFDPVFDKLFAFGIDPVDGGLPQDKPSDWPALNRILHYNRQVRVKLDSCLESASFTDTAIPYFRDGWAFNIAIEHRLMHAETLAYMLHRLPYERKVPQSADPEIACAPARRRMVEIPDGTVTLGLDRVTHGTVGWDNEYERHTIDVPAFAIDSHNVTNGDFLSFVRAGGYQEHALWEAADWAWRKGSAVEHPQFWVRRGDRWFWRGMFAEIPLPQDWPVFVSHAEALAFARWIGRALPTESQLQRAAAASPDGRDRAYPWGDEPPSRRHGNFDFQRWDPAPVGYHRAGASAFGVSDLVGNGWEWTRTLFEPFPGFKSLPFYPGYSANFFDGKHYVLKGGSPLTHASLLRRSFRNWFQPHYPYPYATFRCVQV